ncbi:MAG: FAH family protein [Inquilinus sp.]|nr:FAH family protein [Inquilinus sp.]
MRLIQFTGAGGGRQVGLVSEDGHTVRGLDGARTVYALAREAIDEGAALADLAGALATGAVHDYDAIVADGRLLAPLDHPDPAHLLVTGTGLTHLGSAATRDKMHAEGSAGDAPATDSMKMFRAGLAGGKPAEGEIGVQPEWFFKGDGGAVVAPEQPLAMPEFALDGGEEPEIAGLYVIGPDGTPYRAGFALGNEFSDHVTERQNYLLLAHSKLRPCSFGPELLLGALPRDVRGTSRLLRAGEPVWQAEFLSGEANMSHSLGNLEHHHFKYPMFRRPGDAHVHFFGTATLSFADDIRAEPGAVFEIAAAGFGRPLRNPLARLPAEGIAEVRVL